MRLSIFSFIQCFDGVSNPTYNVTACLKNEASKKIYQCIAPNNHLVQGQASNMCTLGVTMGSRLILRGESIHKFLLWFAKVISMKIEQESFRRLVHSHGLIILTSNSLHAAMLHNRWWHLFREHRDYLQFVSPHKHVQFGVKVQNASYYQLYISMGKGETSEILTGEGMCNDWHTVNEVLTYMMNRQGACIATGFFRILATLLV